MIAVTMAKKLTFDIRDEEERFSMKEPLLVFRNVPDPIADNSKKYFGQSDNRGHVMSGSYSVHLPDGRIQTVKYYVNGDGNYVADVTYEGVANTVSQNSKKSAILRTHIVCLKD